MKLVCEIEIADASPITKLDAIAHASRHEELWRVVKSREEIYEEICRHTNLEGKCGSCRFFKPAKKYGKPLCRGICRQGRACRDRTKKACKLYERKGE